MLMRLILCEKVKLLKIYILFWSNIYAFIIIIRFLLFNKISDALGILSKDYSRAWHF
jgi:hypothetical protein